MKRSIIALALALCLIGAAEAGQVGQGASQPQAKTPAQQRYEEELRRYREAQQRYEQGVRDAEAARQQYDADSARYQQELERQRQADAEYTRRWQEYNERRQREERRQARASRSERVSTPSDRGASTTPADSAGTSDSSAAAASDAQATANCEDRSRRNRRRGRTIGGFLGGIARTFTPVGGVAGLVTGIVPVGELLGEAIASMLDCEEQQQAANATEEAVRGGVGTTASWTSPTRAGVSGSSTVTALEQEAGGGECMTVTDVVIVDGEETRAPKRLCRRPPSSRFVRV